MVLLTMMSHSYQQTQQQVTLDLVKMVFSAATYIALAGAAWVLLRLVYACFWLPSRLKKQNNVQNMLQDKIEDYEKYLNKLEEDESKELEGGGNDKEDGAEGAEGEKKPSMTREEREKQWKERRECLDMLKKELSRMQSGDEPYKWDDEENDKFLEKLLKEEDEKFDEIDKSDEKSKEVKKDK